MGPRMLTAAAGWVGLCGAAAGQDCPWARVGTGGPSSSRGAMAYDSARGRVVLYTGSPTPGNTWEWDGAGWSLRATAGPGPRASAAMAYDAARGRAVLFGGSSSAGYFDDTWVWDGAAWVQAAAAGPSRRSGMAMVYDSVRSRILLHGGQYYNGTTVFTYTDTWAWDGAAWAQVAAGGPPPGKMAYDSDRDRAVLAAVVNFNEVRTWEWDGTAWTQQAGTIPGVIRTIAAAYDPAGRRTVLYGGTSTNSAFLDTWAWDGVSWSLRATTGPGFRSEHSIVWNAGTSRVFLYGGDDRSVYSTDAWELDLGAAAAPLLIPQPPPGGTSLDPGATLRLSVGASGAGPLAYQWFKNGEALEDGGRVSGVGTAELTMVDVVCTDRGNYSVRVSDRCGAVTPPQSTVQVNCPCYPNCDRSVVPPILNVLDFACFVNAYAAGCAPTGECYVNCDGSTTPPVLNVNDFVCFLNAFARGCE